MGKIKDKFQFTVADQATKTVLKALQEDKPEKLLQLVDLAEKAAGDIYRPETFENFRNVIKDPDNHWMRMVKRGVRDIDSHLLYQNAINIIYWASIYGIHRKNELQEKYQCNIPNIILFDPTTACNKHCKGCWSAEYGNKWNLSYEEMHDIVEQGQELGCFMYLMTGGEPLVRKADILKLAKEFPHSAFHIFTNASLIDAEFCEQVKEVGNISFAVSLEGFEDANDARRGEGTFKEITSAMKLMKQHHIGFACSVCYTSQNYKIVTSDAFLKMLIQLGAFHVWYFHYMPIGRDAAPELLLSHEQREYMIRRIRFLRSMDSDLEIFVADFQNDGQFVGGCIAGGRNYLHINAKGDIEPCVFIHYSNSNIRDTTILEAMQQPLLKAYHDGQPFDHNHMRPCPMLERSHILPDLVKQSGAKSTDYVAPETPEQLHEKTGPYDEQWYEYATELWKEYGPEHPEGYPEKRAEYKEQQAKWQAEITQELKESGILDDFA